MLRKCPRCSKEFKTDSYELRHGRGIYCGVRCKYLALGIRIEKKCLNCMNIFVTNKSHITRDTTRGKFCSRTCKSYYQTVRYNCAACGKECIKPKSGAREWLKLYCSMECYSEGKKTGEWRECPTCKKQFWANRTKMNMGFDVYCSRACNREHLKRGEMRECANCGTKFYVSGWSMKEGWGIYCNRKCIRRPELMGKSPMDGRTHTDKVKQLLRELRAKQKFLKQDTNIERIIQRVLDDLRIAYEHPYSISMSRFVCLFDFAMPERKIAIECDGDYWHSLPRSIARDKRKSDWCFANGWKLIRLSESDINNNLDFCIGTIKNIMKTV